MALIKKWNAHCDNCGEAWSSTACYGYSKAELVKDLRAQGWKVGKNNSIACDDCGSTGHDTGSNTCPGPDTQDKLENPNG